VDTVAQLVANGLIAGSGYGLLGLSLGLIYATTHFFHFAHGAVYTVAAYAAFAFIALSGLDAWLGIPSAIAVAALFGAAVDGFGYAPLRRRGAAPLTLLVASLGIFVAVQAVLSVAFGPGVQRLHATGADAPVALFGARFTVLQSVTVALSAGLYALTFVALHHSRSGRLMRAVGSDPRLALIYGIEGERVVMLSFAAGSALAGVAAVLAAYDTGLRPSMGFNALLVAVVAVVVGGVRHPTGAYWGGMTLGFVQQIGAWVLPSQWQDVIVYAILIVLLFLRPASFRGGSASRAE